MKKQNNKPERVLKTNDIEFSINPPNIDIDNDGKIRPHLGINKRFGIIKMKRYEKSFSKIESLIGRKFKNRKTGLIGQCFEIKIAIDSGWRIGLENCDEKFWVEFFDLEDFELIE